MLKKVILAGFILSFAGSQTIAEPTETSKNSPSKEFPTLTIVNHPLVQHKLTLMRDKATGTMLFRQLLEEIGLLIGYEVTRSLEVSEKTVETPIATTKGVSVNENGVVIVPILRAGLGMAGSLQTLMPSASQGHIGISRDPETKKAIEYYFKIPTVKGQTFIVVDPMLATGNSAVAAIEMLVKKGIPIEKILFMALVVAPEGVRALTSKFPTLRIFTASLDEKLNDHSYIVPGLGDAGDRIFGTE